MTTDTLIEEILGPRQALEIDKLFRACVKLEGSDLHLKVGRAPLVRVKGELRSLNREAIDDKEMTELIRPLLLGHRAEQVEENGGSDFAHSIDVEETSWRFRVNILRQMGHFGLVARRVNNAIPSFEGLHLPPVMEDLCKFDQGMILLSGPTGSGKSTTIASMLDWINRHYRKHILTLEDPVEFVFTEDKCVVTQREVGIDVKDFSHGMRQAVREDPDVILLGEMRDKESFQAALQAAETGHLVFGTIHASGAPSTIGRILNLFPEEMHASLRSGIAYNMRGIISQKLLPSIKEGVPRVPTVEVMTFTSMIKKLVIDEEDSKLADALQIGAQDGMQTFTMSLKQLVNDGLIDRPTAFEAAPNLESLKMALKGIDVTQRGIL